MNKISQILSIILFCLMIVAMISGLISAVNRVAAANIPNPLVSTSISTSTPIRTAQEGDTVKVLYTGTLDDGTVIDSSELHGGDPLEFTIGEGRLLPAFEQAVIGLSINESTTIHVPVDEAYGPYNEEMIITVDWSQFEEGFVPEVGEKLYMRDASGQLVEVTVLDVSEAGVVVDTNHPLAGKDLNFDITLVEIVTPDPGSGLADTPWPMYLHDPQHTGRSDYSGPNVPHLKWSYTTGNIIQDSTPVIGNDGTIYVGSFDHKLYAINSDGSLKWSYTTGGPVDDSAAIAGDGTIYVGSQDHKLYAINPDGSLKWSYTTGDQVNSAPAIGADGTIYVGSQDHKLYAINPDGSLKWSYATGSIVNSAPAIGTDGTIYADVVDDKLYAINPDGSLKWSYTTGVNYNTAPAVGNDGTIYICCERNNICAINPDGSLKWSYDTGDWIAASPAISTTGTIYVTNYVPTLYAFNPDGSLKWSYDTGGGTMDTSPLIAVDGTIFVCPWDGNLHAIDSNGDLLWNFHLGGVVYSSLAMGDDNTLYVGSTDHKLYAIGEQSPVTPEPDTTPPNTTITVYPSGTISYNDVTFTWTGSDDVTPTSSLVYSYKLEGFESSWSSPYTSSTSKSYSDLPNGPYTFMVRAKDSAENIDPIPDSKSFTVDVDIPDTTPPDTTITVYPSGTISYNDVSFTWTGSDDVTPTSSLVYSYKLEGYESSWSSPYTSSTSKSYSDLPNGPYTFMVRAKDSAENIDPIPDSKSFTVDVDIPEITVVSPSGGDDWELVSRHTITWSSSHAGSNVKIKLYKDSRFYKTISYSTPNDGSYSWDIPKSYDAYSSYRIKVTDTSDPSTYGYSGYFKLSAPPEPVITVTIPSGGEDWKLGSPHTIIWSSSHAGSNVKIQLYKGSSYYKTIESSTSNDGSYPWDIPENYDAYSSYRIKITDTSDSSTYDFSSYFKLSAPPKIPPVAIFTWALYGSGRGPFVSTEITFDASSAYDRDGGWITSYKWDFDDGHSANTKIAKYAYGKSGTYTVTLTVTDNDGLKDSASQDFTIKPLPVLLLHGIWSHPDRWDYMLSLLQGEGFDARLSWYAVPYCGRVPIVGLYPCTNKDIRGYAKVLSENIANVKSWTGAPKVDLVCHSMGGLVARWYTKSSDYSNDVARLIMIGTPNHGSELMEKRLFLYVLSPALGLTADFALGAGGEQMHPDSEFLRILNSRSLNDKVQHTVIAGTDDWLLTRAFLPGLDDGLVSTDSARLYGIGLDSVYVDHFNEGKERKTFEIVRDTLNSAFTGSASIQTGQSFAASTYVQQRNPMIISNTYPEGDNSPGVQQVPMVFSSILPDVQKTHDIPISATSTVTFILSWAGSDLDMTLTTPDSTLIDMSVADSDPNISYHYDNGTTIKGYTVQNPEAGIWKVNIDAVDVPSEGEDYAVMAILETTITLSLNLAKHQYDPGEDINIIADLEIGGEPLPGASVTAEVLKPDDSIESVTLYDDGLHGDGVASDGVYANTYGDTASIGDYEIVIDAIGVVDSEEFTRQVFSTVWVEQYPDLMLSSADISLSKDNPVDGEQITISATIHNIGDGDATEATIMFYDGEPASGTLIGEDIIAITSGGIEKATVLWDAGGAGNHEVYVLVSSYNAFLEEDYDNNTASKMVVVSSASTSTTNELPIWLWLVVGVIGALLVLLVAMIYWRVVRKRPAVQAEKSEE